MSGEIHVDCYLEVWTEGVPGLVALTGDEVTVGRADSNTVPVAGDDTVSRIHAVLVRYPSGWCVRDLGSSNGTTVNGKRISSDQKLDAGDEIRVGTTRLVFRSSDSAAANPTVTAAAPPAVTAREREVLIALCQPLIASPGAFAEPSSIRTIAEQLVVSEAAVKFHLTNLYDKFAIHDDKRSRRVALANEAILRGAVTRADLVPRSDWSSRTSQ